MLQKTGKLDLALFYHRQLPGWVREYLQSRGLTDAVIDRMALGWNGSRITLPVFGRKKEVLFFRYAKSPRDESQAPKVLSDPGVATELYGWDTLEEHPFRVVICEGEFDRLVLESNGIKAVTSTSGATSFLEEWAPHFEGVTRIFACFDLDEAGARGAAKVKSVFPRATIVTLPPEVGPKGDISDYFVRLGKTATDFEVLLAIAAAKAEDATNPDEETIKDTKATKREVAEARRAKRVKDRVPLASIAGQYTELKPSGNRLTGRCPFHEDMTPSFTVYPETETYYCFGCQAHGDVISFIQKKQSKTYHQALEELECLLYPDDQHREQAA